MDFNKKLLTLLAIFCLIASAGAVCAADYDGHAGSNYEDMNGVSGSQYNPDDQDMGAGIGHDVNSTAGRSGKTLEPGAGLPLENQTAHATGNATGNATAHAAGGHVNATSNATNKTTGNSTGNATPHTMLATGNPILALLAIGAVLGGATIITRKK